MIEITNEDNMQLMARYEDNYFDLAIVDPPYGINIKTRVFNDGKKWDSKIPEKEYFDELFRVSKNQIIWGGNYYIEYLKNSPCWIVWDKLDTTVSNQWRAELAWTSFDKSTYICKTKRPGERGFFTVDYKRIHPTQKAVALYKYCLNTYAKKGDKILDTHLGSGSIAIACHEYKFDLTACEIDKQYFNDAAKRLKIAQMQTKLF